MCSSPPYARRSPSSSETLSRAMPRKPGPTRSWRVGDSRKPSPTPLHRATSSTQTPSPSRSAWPAPARYGFSGPGRLSAWETTGAARSMEAPGGRRPRRWGPTRIPRIRTTTSSSPRDPRSASSTRPTTRGRRPTTTCSWWEDPERARPATTSSRTWNCYTILGKF